MKDRLDMPDGIRVIAIGLIMWFHIWQQSWLEPVIRIGGTAIDLSAAARTGYIMVDVMLMLSGYLLFSPVARGGGIDKKSFYIKRLIRIVPCYLLSIFVMLFCFALPGGEYKTSGEMWKDIITHLTFTQTFFHDTYVGTSLNVVLWTLCVEMQFYLIFPFLAPAFKKRPLACYAVMVTASVLFRELYVMNLESKDMLLNQLPTMLDVYANGMLAAYITAELEKREDTKITKIFFTLLMLFGFVCVWRLMKDQYAVSFPLETRKLGQLERRFELSALAALILVSGERSFLYIRRLFGNRVTRFLSLISFNVYIWHQALAVKLKIWKIPNYVSEAPNSAGEQPWQLVYTLLCFSLSIILAILITYLFERPVSQKLTKICMRRS